MRSVNYPLHILAACVFLSAAGAIYSNSLHSPFIGDDHLFFSEQPYSFHYIMYQIFPDLHRLFGTGVQMPDMHYRPLMESVAMLCHLAFGENMFSFHVFNLLLFGSAVFCIYAFIAALFKDFWLGFLAGFLYCMHPINSIIVNYVMAAILPVQVMLMLGSLYFLTVRPIENRFNMVMACLLYLLSLWCHESAFILPFYAVSIWAIARGMSIKKAFKKSIPLWVLSLFYFLFHLRYASFNDSIFGSLRQLHISFSQYLATLTKILCWYLSNLILPTGIVFSWATPVVKQGAGIWLLVLGILLAVFIFALYYCRHKKTALLALLWLGIGFLPLTLACLVEPTQGFLIEPHWFAFSSIGFFLFLAFVIRQIPLSFRIAAIAVLLISWPLACRVYNYLWGDEVRYDLYWMGQDPGFLIPKMFLARAYYDKNDLERARYYYRSCISNMYIDNEFYANIGVIDLLEGNDQAAKINFSKALAIEPRLDSALSNLGLIAVKEGHLQLAKDYFSRSMKVNAFSKSPRYNMARILEQEGHTDDAIRIYRSILELAPHEENALILLLKIYWERKDYKQVTPIARELAGYSHRQITQYNLGIIFRSLGLQDEARKAFASARNL